MLKELLAKTNAFKNDSNKLVGTVDKIIHFISKYYNF